jgi:hypothetical protein
MKQTNKKTQTITIDDLRFELDSFENRLGKKFVTKNDLKTERQLLREVVSIDNKFNIAQAMKKFEKILSAHANKIMTMIDPVLKEIIESREDRMVISGKLSAHEQRISTLEKAQNI